MWGQWIYSCSEHIAQLTNLMNEMKEESFFYISMMEHRIQQTFNGNKKGLSISCFTT